MICIVGGKGSIGSRYVQICKYYKIDHVIFDLDTEGDFNYFDKYIICTPTNTHVKFLHALQGKKVLCEKPVDHDPLRIPNYKDMWTVCNYAYLAKKYAGGGPYFIEYDYYKTGPDGIYFDLSQILYLDPKAKIDNRSPKWNMSINGQYVKYRDVENSYIEMIRDFDAGNYENLWTLAQGREMSQSVLDRMARDAL